MDPNRPPQQLYAAPNALQQLQLQQLAAAQMAARPGGNPLLAGAGFRPGLQLPAGMQMAQMQYSVPGRPQAMQMRPAGFAMPAGAVPAMPAVPRPLTGPRPPGAQVAQKGYPQRPPGQFAGPQTVAYGVPRPVQQVQQQPPSGTMPAPKIVDEPPISLSGPKSAKKGTDRRIPPEVEIRIPVAI